MIPDYQRPPLPVNDNWPTAADTTATTSPADLGWRDYFTDPQLQHLITLALANNRDLRVAALNVEKIQAQYRIVRSALFPELDATAGFHRQRIPSALTNTPNATHQTQYTISGAVAAYELDLFGRVRSLKAAALEQYLATAETRRAAQLSLIAETATQYLAARQLAGQLQLARHTLQAAQAIAEVVNLSVQHHIMTDLDLHAAAIQVHAAQASLARYERLLAQTRNTLTLLIGALLPADWSPAATTDETPPLADLTPGLPSDLLLRRPDLRAAEHQLKAANADIGAARAAFFPKILLTGSAGTISAQLSDLFTGPSYMWSFMPQITIPIFDGGRNAAELDVAKITTRIEIANYEHRIQQAFREVADALATRATINEEIRAREQLVTAQQQRYNLSLIRYENGIDNYLGVLTAQQDLYQAQQDLIIARYYRLTNQTALYKALGGGARE
jgi:multidrug efflux system outer membrane protein